MYMYDLHLCQEMLILWVLPFLPDQSTRIKRCKKIQDLKVFSFKRNTIPAVCYKPLAQWLIKAISIPY